MDRFAGAEIDRFTGHPHLLTFQAGEVHFDAMSFTIVKGVMLKHVEPEIPAELAVDARQQVEIEFCRHAFGVIIRGVEHLGGLDQVYPDDKCRAFSQNICGIAQKLGCFVRLKIADGRAGEKADTCGRGLRLLPATQTVCICPR